MESKLKMKNVVTDEVSTFSINLNAQMAISKLIAKRDSMMKELSEISEERERLEASDEIISLKKDLDILQEKASENPSESLNNEILKKFNTLSEKTDNVYERIAKKVSDFYSITEDIVSAILIPETETKGMSKKDFIDLHIANFKDANIVVDFFLTLSAQSTELPQEQTVIKM